MRIATVTLNPAIDQTVRADNFQPNTVNRGQFIRFDAGGKGVNVASFLADYSFPVAVTGFLGRDNSTIFEQLFTRKQIEDRFVRLPGHTRTGVKIVDPANQQTTDINLPGLSPSAEALDQLLEVIEQLSGECDWYVLAGNLPPEVPTGIYAEIIERLKAAGKRSVLDTSGEALREGLAARPTVVKPNLDELRQLAGQDLTNQTQVEEVARGLLGGGLELVVVSMGAQGALFVDRQRSLLATPPSVTVTSTVGAGDAMVAGLIAGRLQNLSLEETARLATAFSLGRLTRLGADLPDRDILENYSRQVSICNLKQELLVQNLVV